MPPQIITIDTDHAKIRFYTSRARERGIGGVAIRSLLADLETLAIGLANAHKTTYHVEIVL